MKRTLRRNGMLAWLCQRGKRKLWYFRFRAKRLAPGGWETVEVLRSSGTAIYEVAADRAWEVWCEMSGVDSGGKPLPKFRSEAPTVGQIVDAYVGRIGEFANVQQRTAKANAAALLDIVAASSADARTVRLSALTEETVRAWRRKRYADRGFSLGRDRPLDLNLSLNSYFQQARSVFSDRAGRLYEAEGLRMPDLSGFLHVPRLAQATRRFRPIAPETLREMEQTLEQMVRREWSGTLGWWGRREGPLSPEEQAAVVVSVQLARWYGLTSKEICGARWSWIEEREDGPVMSIRFRSGGEGEDAWESKRASKDGDIRLSAHHVALWRELIPGLPEDFIIPGRTTTERLSRVQRMANAFVRRFIPDRAKGLHELRKQAGSEIAAREGIWAAAEFLRDSLDVAREYYVGVIRLPEPLRGSA